MLPKLPLASWINQFVNWLSDVLGPVLGAVSQVVQTVVSGITVGLEHVPWWLLTLVIAALGYLAGRWKLAIGTLIGLLLIEDLRLWNHMIETLVLVIVSSFVAVVIGIPLGIWAARRKSVYQVMSPLLDLMQTMPPFVYLVPVLLLFSIGVVPAILATVVFSMPPAIRLTRLGILQVPDDLVEAARAFGTSDRQLLWKVQLPLAMASIKAGINQTLMLALSMVVIAAMIGASGLGADVMSALETVDVGKGVEAGLSIVIIAIILDRISQNLGKRRSKPSA
ncbi:ABC transporter permease [Alicyclobacillus herbarius]|uniref:ABC transporter permease n=1 Tax=Alicyclobacillus herbarius TaxID=122960 RepID=UPI00041C1748|nr:proline/glycine betaine ABC transporter permease [Alicyclobacillus herbarius]